MDGTVSEVQQLFDAVSAAGGLPPFEFDGEGSCRIDTEAGLSVHFQIREDAHDIVMLSPLGTVSPEAQGDVCRALLAANFYWNDTFGATLCWNDRIDEAVLEYALPSETLTAEALATAMGNFAELAEAWKERLAQLAETAETESEAEPEGDGMPRFVP